MQFFTQKKKNVCQVPTTCHWYVKANKIGKVPAHVEFKSSCIEVL